MIRFEFLPTGDRFRVEFPGPKVRIETNPSEKVKMYVNTWIRLAQLDGNPAVSKTEQLANHIRSHALMMVLETDTADEEGGNIY